MKNRTHLYEGMYIFSASLSEEAMKKAISRITSSIEEKGGEVKKVFDHGKRKLAYEINNMRQGHYVSMYFAVSSLAVDPMWKEYHLNEDLLRYVTLRTEEMKETLELKPVS